MLSTEKTTEADPFEKFPLDFNAFLGARLGVDRGSAIAALGRWLKHYEPALSGPGLAAGPRRRSGVFSAPCVHDDRATAKSGAA